VDWARIGRAVRSATGVWLVASALTLVSWRLAVPHGHSAGHIGSSLPEVLAVLAIATVKVRLVARHFMEVRTAPRWLRRFTDIWLAVLVATLAAVYLYYR
jgi:hypothetical protein